MTSVWMKPVSNIYVGTFYSKVSTYLFSDIAYVVCKQMQIKYACFLRTCIICFILYNTYVHWWISTRSHVSKNIAETNGSITSLVLCTVHLHIYVYLQVIVFSTRHPTHPNPAISYLLLTRYTYIYLYMMDIKHANGRLQNFTGRVTCLLIHVFIYIAPHAAIRRNIGKLEIPRHTETQIYETRT